MKNTYPPESPELEELVFQRREEAEEMLVPLHEDLASEAGDGYRGITAWAIDDWHVGNASEVARLQPVDNGSGDYNSYHGIIRDYRLDLASSAFGLAMALGPDHAQKLRSKLLPREHDTFTVPTIIDHQIAGGVQVALDVNQPSPSSQTLERMYKKHDRTIKDVFASFRIDGIRSVGDVLNNNAPITPNVLALDCDLDGSTELAKSHYGTLRKILLVMKRTMRAQARVHRVGYKDYGDNQMMLFWLPDGVRREVRESVSEYGNSVVLPKVESTIQAIDNEFIKRAKRLGFLPTFRYCLSAGYFERNEFEDITSQEVWLSSSISKERRGATLASNPRIFLTEKAEKYFTAADSSR